MDINTVVLQSKIKDQEDSLRTYAEAAQADINNQKNVIQELQLKLQEALKLAQREIDQRTGAIDQLKALVKESEQAAPDETGS